MSDLFGWIVLGGVYGFYRAWKKTSESAGRARKIIDSVPDVERKTRAEVIGYSQGLRLVALIVGTLIYAVIGAAIWGAATLFLKLM